MSDEAKTWISSGDASEQEFERRQAADRYGVPLGWYEREHDRMTAALKEALTEHMTEAMAQWLVQQKVAEPRWIPVTERLPEDDVEVVVCFDNGVRVSGRITQGQTFWHLDDEQLCGYVKRSGVRYWQPLPEAPKP